MMKKMLLILLTVLLCWPLCAGADVTYIRQEKKFIDFPELDDWRGHFTKVETWTIVTADNLDEHLDLVLARGDSEEAIRRRFAKDSLVFEAYSTEIPGDACFRFERYESEFTRDIWHLRHWSTAERKKIIEDLTDGTILPDYDVFSLKSAGNSDKAYFEGWFTNYPPDVHEGGKIQIHFRNGVMYVMSYNVCGRMAADKRYYTWREETQMTYVPLDTASKFRSKLQPRPARLTLAPLTPVHADVGSEVTVTGTMEQGSKLTVTLGGASIPVEKKGKDGFQVRLPIQTAGDHQAVFTLSHSKYQDRVRTVTIRATEDYAPLIFTAFPETYISTGDQTIAGTTAPGASLTLRLDGADPISIPVDDAGTFNYTLPVEDDKVHTLRIEAEMPDRQTTCYEKEFIASFEDAEDAIRYFKKDLSDTPVEEMFDDPTAYIGQRVSASIYVHTVTLEEDGLGLRCIWNYKNRVARNWYERGESEEEIYLYLKIPGYVQDQVYEQMILSVYGTVTGTHPVTDAKGVTTDVLAITVDYATYLK